MFWILLLSLEFGLPLLFYKSGGSQETESSVGCSLCPFFDCMELWVNFIGTMNIFSFVLDHISSAGKDYIQSAPGSGDHVVQGSNLGS